ncbi:MAG: PaaI family thioesterase [Pacificimonas sp.]|jgi:uncharacterized protein (TIGR00369 family)|nr:PaaI family thioesterase [Pacificimonas sp.]
MTDDETAADPAIDPAVVHAHLRGLERLYAAAPINGSFASRLVILEEGRAQIHFTVEPRHFHAAGAAHGTVYFKMLDDAAFYAVNTAVRDVFILTTGFNLQMERPLTAGPLIAEGRLVSGRRRLFVGESRLMTADGEEVARGTGNFMRSKIALGDLPGYAGEPG